jgi:hypothetical protein
MNQLPKDCEDIIHQYVLQLRISRVNAEIERSFSSFQKTISDYMMDLRCEWCDWRISLTDWPELEQSFLNRWQFAMLSGRPKVVCG